jgi:hypothetical protein
MYPTSEQASIMLEHCAHARYVWNLAVEQHSHWYKGRNFAPGFAEQCKQLTEARRASEWLREGNADVQQQALKDFAKAKNAKFNSGFGEPTWRKKFKHEGFRVIGTDRVPESEPDGSPKLNAKTGKQVMGRSVVVQKLNRRWAQVKVPGCGWVRFRLTRTGLPVAKTSSAYTSPDPATPRVSYGVTCCSPSAGPASTRPPTSRGPSPRRAPARPSGSRCGTRAAASSN